MDSEISIALTFQWPTPLRRETQRIYSPSFLTMWLWGSFTMMGHQSWLTSKLVAGVMSASKFEVKKWWRVEQLNLLMNRGDAAFVAKYGKRKVFHLGSNSSCCQHICLHYELYKTRCAEQKMLKTHIQSLKIWSKNKQQEWKVKNLVSERCWMASLPQYWVYKHSQERMCWRWWQNLLFVMIRCVSKVSTTRGEVKLMKCSHLL